MVHNNLYILKLFGLNLNFISLIPFYTLEPKEDNVEDNFIVLYIKLLILCLKTLKNIQLAIPFLVHLN